jgi:hypothetical protein
LIGVGTALDLFINMDLPNAVPSSWAQHVFYGVEFFVGRHRLFPSECEIPPSVGSVRCKVVLRRPLVCPQIFVPFTLIAAKALNAATATCKDRGAIAKQAAGRTRSARGIELLPRPGAMTR